MKKQLDSTSSSVQTIQKQHSTHLLDLQNKLQDTHSKSQKNEENNQNLLQELHRSESELYTVSEQLKKEQRVVDEQRNKIAALEQERSKLVKGWKEVKSTII